MMSPTPSYHPAVPSRPLRCIGFASTKPSYDGTSVALRPFMHAKSRILVLWCLLFAAACGRESPVGPTVPLSQRFTLAPGQSASVQGTSLRVQFLRVSGDSRCPADAVCIQGGDAVVHVRATGAFAAEYELHTGDHSRAVVTYGDFRIELAQLQPYPFSSRTIDPSEYRATLVVTR